MQKLFPLPPWPQRLFFVTEMARLSEGGLNYIKNWIEGSERPRLVIIDTLAMVRMPNRKDLTAYDADNPASARAATERSLPFHWDIDPARMMRPRFADSIRASSPSGLREQTGHMTASDFCAARYIFSCQAGAIHT